MEVEQPEWLAQMEGVLETLNEGVIVVDDCSHIIFTNSVFLEMTGFSSDALLGQLSTQLYNPEDAAFIEAQREKGRRSGHNRFEFVVPQKDGNRLPVIISARRLEDPDGRQFAVITFADISEQKRAEAELREANVKLEERQKEIEDELALAARVQQTLAPKSLVWGGLRVDTYYHPVRSIGGDFGLVTPQNDDHLNLLVFDVSGHGIGAALVANRLYSETMTQLRARSSFGDMFRQLNRFVMQNIGSSVFFFTVAAARIDRAARRMVFAGAGHPPGMVVTPGEEPRLLESRSMVLGALPNAVDVEATLDVDLDPGDRIVLYTDGITDVFDSQGEMLGVPGVQKFVREAALLPFAEMKQGILDRVADWREGPPSDDVSIVLAEVI
ncbi:MAG TPA: SpoIIE family protein phosphatase [Candidatus Acidoferrales bacterium]|nr:SpoIIE family protein phosphatase [Candidatus Acidoferrales bacterium]